MLIRITLMFRCVIEGTVDGLKPGEHGLAVHETGDISQGCNTVGDHYNPRYLIVSTIFCYLSMGSSMCWRLQPGLCDLVRGYYMGSSIQLY